jgi:hypothetical protein
MRAECGGQAPESTLHSGAIARGQPGLGNRSDGRHTRSTLICAIQATTCGVPATIRCRAGRIEAGIVRLSLADSDPFDAKRSPRWGLPLAAVQSPEADHAARLTSRETLLGIPVGGSARRRGPPQLAHASGPRLRSKKFQIAGAPSSPSRAPGPPVTAGGGGSGTSGEDEPSSAQRFRRPSRRPSALPCGCPCAP